MTRLGPPCHTRLCYNENMSVREIIRRERANPVSLLGHWAGWFGLAAVWTGVIWTAVGR
jgi:hypothetical protein